jgi:hypothetical protein
MDHCIFPGCITKPLLTCTCSDKKPKICNFHFQDHIIQYPNCKALENFFRVFTTESEDIVNKCENARSKLFEAKRKILDKSKEIVCQIIEITQKGVEKLREIERELQEFRIEAENSFKEGDIRSKGNWVTVFVNSTEKIEGIVRRVNEIEEKTIMKIDFNEKIEENKRQCNQLIENCKNQCKADMESFKNQQLEQKVRMAKAFGITIKEDIQENLELIDKCSEKNDQFMCYFDKNSKNLNIIDVNSNKDTKHTLNELNTNWSYMCASALLPGNKYFTYACDITEIYSSYSNLAFIIGIDDKTIEVCMPSKSQGYSGESIYYNGCVYVFGAYTSKTESTSEKYDILTRKWFDIASLPSPSCWNCTVLVDNLIFIAGIYSTIVSKYNTIDDSISSYGNFADIYKRICYAFGKIYLFVQENIYESTNVENPEFVRISSSSSLSNRRVISYSVQNGVNIYFLQEDWIIYRFNVLTKHFDKFRSVTF